MPKRAGRAPPSALPVGSCRGHCSLVFNQQGFSWETVARSLQTSLPAPPRRLPSAASRQLGSQSAHASCPAWHQAPAHLPTVSPESASKLRGYGHKGLRLPRFLLGAPAGPDAVVPVTESWDRGQHVQVIGRGHLLRALDLQDLKDGMNDGCQGWKVPQSPRKSWAYTPGGWSACLTQRQLVIQHWAELGSPPAPSLLNWVQSPLPSSSFSTGAANHLPSSHTPSCSCL